MKLKSLSPDAVKASALAGEPIVAKLSRAPGNDAPIYGLKVISRDGWFAARPRKPSRSTSSTPRASRMRRISTPIIREARDMVSAAVSNSVG